MTVFTSEDGINLYYEKVGRDNGPVLLLLHGLAANLGIWKPQIGQLSEHFQVYNVDLPGHGRSSHLPAYDIQAIPHLLKAFVDHLGLEKVNILGLSIGSTIAVLFAVHYPQVTQSLILQGPAQGIVPFRNPRAWLKYLQLQATVRGVFVLWTLLGKHKAGYVINWIGRTYKYARLLTLMEEKTDPRALLDYSLSNADAPFLNHPLESIRAPVLILRGVEDQFAIRYTRYICNRLKASVCLWLAIPDAQHLINLTNPMEFNLAVTAFLQKVASQDVLSLNKSLHEDASSILNRYRPHNTPVLVTTQES